MPIGDQDHRRVPVAASVLLCGLDKHSNFHLGQVLSAAKLTVRPSQRSNCSFFGGWRCRSKCQFCWHFPVLNSRTARKTALFRALLVFLAHRAGLWLALLCITKSSPPCSSHADTLRSSLRMDRWPGRLANTRADAATKTNH